MLNLDDPRFRLNNVLTRYQALSEARASAATRTRPSEPDGAAFDHLAREVIRPVMEEIGAALDQRGHGYEIVIIPGHEIVMYFYPASLRRSMYHSTTCRPFVSFSRDPMTEKIHVVQSTLMPIGRGRAETTATLADVTRSGVEAQILGALENVLNELER